MTEQWIRKCELIIGDNNGDALDVSQLRIVFRVRRPIMQTPGSAHIRIYNLSKETASKIQKEYTRISLKAGYKQNSGLIFSGTVKQWLTGRESPTDTYLDILAADGDQAYNYAVVNKTLAPGSTFKDQLSTIEKAMKPMGVSLGFIPDLGEAKAVRSRVLFGMARDYLRTLAKSTGCTWNIEDGKINFIKTDGVRPGEAIVLNSRSGLIGIPVQTMDGIVARALINPDFKIGSQIKIDQSSVQGLMMGTSLDADVVHSTKPDIAADGYYKIILLQFSGDTRGRNWYADMTLNAVNGTGGSTAKVLGSGMGV